MGIFDFFKKNKDGLSKAELNFAEKLNIEIRNKRLEMLLPESIREISKSIYQLSANRARIKVLPVDDIDDVGILMSNPQIFEHTEVFQAMPKFLNPSVAIIIRECMAEKSTDETLDTTKKILEPIIKETASRLKTLK